MVVPFKWGMGGGQEGGSRRPLALTFRPIFGSKDTGEARRGAAQTGRVTIERELDQKNFRLPHLGTLTFISIFKSSRYLPITAQSIWSEI